VAIIISNNQNEVQSIQIIDKKQLYNQADSKHPSILRDSSSGNLLTTSSLNHQRPKSKFLKKQEEEKQKDYEKY
jgi:hypothetical protein